MEQFLSFSKDVYGPPMVGGPVDSHYPPGSHYGATGKIPTHTVTHNTKNLYGNNGNNRSGVESVHQLHRQKKFAVLRFRVDAKTVLRSLLLPLQIKTASLGFDLRNAFI